MAKIKQKTMGMLLLAIPLLLLVLSFTKFEIRHDIEINASPETVWKAILNFPNYKAWNTQLVFLGGDVQANGNLHLKLSATGTEPYEFKPIISSWEENKKFAWLAQTAGIPRIFDGEHFFELKDLGNGKTLLTNREEYRGILSLIFKNLPMMKDAPQGFKKMNVELKNHIESQN